ncbi:MAG: hypothetical protein DYG98_08405 [Haliscomenobacteraceae bacterium CHB4]|nr:hypothetical protein [Haliscomenobacteraceae bacterium CHB4]
MKIEGYIQFRGNNSASSREPQRAKNLRASDIWLKRPFLGVASGSKQFGYTCSQKSYSIVPIRLEKVPKRLALHPKGLQFVPK